MTAEMIRAARRENGRLFHHVLKRTTITGTAYPTSGGAHGKQDRHTLPRKRDVPTNRAAITWPIHGFRHDAGPTGGCVSSLGSGWNMS